MKPKPKPVTEPVVPEFPQPKQTELKSKKNSLLEMDFSPKSDENTTDKKGRNTQAVKQEERK